jgi:hypothetical protein
MHIATYTVENLFRRAKVLNLDATAAARPILDDVQRLNELLSTATYSPKDKEEIKHLLQKRVAERGCTAMIETHCDRNGVDAEGDEIWYKPGNGKSNALGCRREGIHRRIAAAFVACLLCVPGFMLGKDKDKDEASEKHVEIKCLVPENKIADVSKNLSLDAEHPTETRVVCFYDTSSNTLFEHAPRVILRSRYATDGTKAYTTVKNPRREAEGRGHRVRVDQVIGKPRAESCSLTDKKQPVDEIKKANEGKGVKEIFNHDQEAFVKEANVDLDWKSLVPFGPVEGVKVWKNVSAEGLEKVTVERWELPERDGKPRRVLCEVSTKVSVSQESEATAALSKALGITGTEEQEQETKTKIVLDHFSGNHPAKP